MPFNPIYKLMPLGTNRKHYLYSCSTFLTAYDKDICKGCYGKQLHTILGKTCIEFVHFLTVAH